MLLNGQDYRLHLRSLDHGNPRALMFPLLKRSRRERVGGVVQLRRVLLETRAMKLGGCGSDSSGFRSACL